MYVKTCTVPLLLLTQCHFQKNFFNNLLNHGRGVQIVSHAPHSLKEKSLLSFIRVQEECNLYGEMNLVYFFIIPSIVSGPGMTPSLASH